MTEQEALRRYQSALEQYEITESLADLRAMLEAQQVWQGYFMLEGTE